MLAQDWAWAVSHSSINGSPTLSGPDSDQGPDDQGPPTNTTIQILSSASYTPCHLAGTYAV